MRKNYEVRRYWAPIFFLAMSLGASASFANPQGGVVAAGSVTISSPSPNTMQIKQTTNKSIINWQSYNIGASEQVHYQQPGASSVSLNRINGGSGVSQIYGHLSSNGQVWLINPAGIYFGPSAHVNVGGLIATTSNIHDKYFLNGNYQFLNTSSLAGNVINDGTIIAAEHGLVALIGSNVTNNGMVRARLGNIVLASGNAYTMNFDGNDLINFQVKKISYESSRDEQWQTHC